MFDGKWMMVKVQAHNDNQVIQNSIYLLKNKKQTKVCWMKKYFLF